MVFFLIYEQVEIINLLIRIVNQKIIHLVKYKLIIMKKIYLLGGLTLSLFGLNKISNAQVTTQTLSYTGSLQTFTVPNCVSQVTITCKGASGANGALSGTGSPGGNGGAGGLAAGIYPVTSGNVLNVYVGGSGSAEIGGFNGGGNGGVGNLAGGAGGASDVRVGGITLSNRVIVPGGGGGGGGFIGGGGGGGGSAGTTGCAGNDKGGGGGGAGGTSYFNPSFTSTVIANGVNTGNGIVTISYTLNPPPVVTVNSGSICVGSSFTITPSGAGSYSYSSGSAVVSPTTTTSYTVTGTTAGCTASVVSSVSVNAIPTVTVNSGAICAGKSFTMIPGGATSYSYSSGSSIVSPTATASYTVMGTTAGCSNSAVSSVTVNANPVLTASTSNSLICIGESAILTASTSATSYTWNTGATTMSVYVSPSVTSTYTVSVSNAASCVTSSTISVIVNACTGINEVVANSISVYPNPSNGILNLSITAELAKNSTLEVYDALSKLVVKQILTNEINSINISNLNNGIYTFKVLNNDKLVKTGKLVKQ